MNRFCKFVAAITVSLGLVGSASAAFDMSGDPGFLGDMGVLDPSQDVSTLFVNGGQNNLDGFLTTKPAAFPIGQTEIPHWYKFTLNQSYIVSDFLEQGFDVVDITLDFFDSTDNVVDFSKTSTGPHNYEQIDTFAAGTWWMRVTGTSLGANLSDDEDNYTIELRASPVPLPPAILLFGSAIAGFGLLGRKKKATS